MTRRRPLTVPEADALLESLGWLRGVGTPNREVRLLFDCAATYRAAVHRQENGEPAKSWVAEVKK